MNIITKYILLFDCVNSSFSDRCVRRRKELRKRRGCARFPSLFFFSLSLFNRLVETKSLCYRFPSGCVTACLPCTPSSLAATLSLHFTKDPQFSTSSFFNSSRSRRRRRRRKKKSREKKRKEPVQRLVGWLVEKRRQFFDPSSVHAHEGIQMQEVTHPVRSIYRSQDRAFIRSILDTRDEELWSWICFDSFFIFLCSLWSGFKSVYCFLIKN